MTSHRPLCVFLTVAALASGCKKPDSPTPPAADPPSSTPSAVADPNAPLTDKDYEDFGRKLEAAVAVGDKPVVDQLFRMTEIMVRVDRELNLNLSPIDREGLRVSAERSGGRVGADAIAAVREGGGYSFLRVHTADGQRLVLMRVITPDDGLTYHEITLARYPDGQVATYDLRDFVKGETLGYRFRRSTLGFVAEKDQAAFDRLSPNDQLHTKHSGTVLAMYEDTLAGRHKEALAKFRSLPGGVQRDHVVQLVAIQAARQLSDEEYLTELERFRRNHPGDAAAEIASLDYFMHKRQCDEALASIDKLDKRVGGDPYLSVIRSEALADAGRYPEARAKAEQAIKDAPKLPQAHWGRVNVAVKEKNHEDTLAWLTSYAEVSGAILAPAALEREPTFAEFVKSPQFQELKRWAAEQGK
jgi:tetratricopeptide (TPR) repeat protein